MAENTDAMIETMVKQVNAILSEAGVLARTGRTRPDLGVLAEETSVTSIIDHTLLRADAMAREIEMLCLEAKQYGFASVCVNSWFVPLATELLKDSDVKVCAVVGFPLGASLPQVKAYEAQEAINDGAREIDMVLAIGALKSRDIVGVFEDITDVAYICHEHPDEVICKVIIETALLTETEIILACQLAKQAGADFVKTSTGFSSGGATVEHVTLMREVVGDGVGVKASGNVSNLAEAQAMIDAGANRIGSHSGVQIAQEERGEAY